MNGTADPLLPYNGGKVGKDKHERGTVLSTPDSVNYWVNINETKQKPVIYKFKDTNQRDKSTVIRHSYKDGKENTEVVLYEVRNGGHTEPSLTEKYRRIYRRIVGNQNYDIEMADEVWQFFKTRRR
jgi:polyhydroxybutyrate depolymerase